MTEEASREAPERVYVEGDLFERISLNPTFFRNSIEYLRADLSAVVPDTAIIANIITDICELPDRTSPEDAPDMMLVTAEELSNILLHYFGQLALAPKPPANTVVEEIARLRTIILDLVSDIDDLGAPASDTMQQARAALASTKPAKTGDRDGT